MEHSEPNSTGIGPLSGVFDNYDDVLSQMRSFGLLIDGIETGRIVRCKVEGGRERRGWYALHEITLNNGRPMLVGTYGLWRGAENNAQKVQIKSTELSIEQRDAIRKRIADDRRNAEIRRKREEQRAALRATKMWWKCSLDGDCAYLARKHVNGYGVRYTDRGNLVIPIHDEHGGIYGLQVIYGDPGEKKSRGRDKDYWPAGCGKRGRFFLIGAPTPILLVVEGYATGASLHEATGHQVALAFDAGNLAPVSQALRKRYPGTRIILCADDDFATRDNPGVSMAQAAALVVSGAVLVPAFTADPLRAAVATIDPAAEDWKAQVLAVTNGRRKLTDFNDLIVSEGLHMVRAQVEAKIMSLGWVSAISSAPAQPSGGRGNAPPGDLKPISSVEELTGRFCIVYGHGGTAFDFQEHMLVKLDDVRDICIHRELHRRWMEYPEKMIVRISEVGFDPAEIDHEIKCNLWGGWPTSPVNGSCDRLLELLEYLCSQEEKPHELYEWVMRWVAYPIQHPGAKMKTALVLHGPQGVGKNLFFESIMAIYAHYGRIVDQMAIEDKFNDWASKKLFLIADEVVARQELYHVKNKLKGFITSDWIRINPKNIGAYEERNHVNVVFLSNETQPLVLERDDRRYTVIWTPPYLSDKFIADVVAEIKDGGIAALHDHLHRVDLGNFGPHTRPPMTRSKTELIELSMDSTERFARDWIAGQIEYVPVLPIKGQELYAFYRDWCGLLVRQRLDRCGVERLPAAR